MTVVEIHNILLGLWKGATVRYLPTTWKGKLDSTYLNIGTVHFLAERLNYDALRFCVFHSSSHWSQYKFI